MKNLNTFIAVFSALVPFIPIFLIFWTTSPTNLRLPTHIRPDTYNITIEPFFGERYSDRRYNFSGDVKIRITSEIRTNYIVLHSRNLHYSSIEYWLEQAPDLKGKIEKIRFDSKTDKLIFYLHRQLRPNVPYILAFKYTGAIQKISYGVFRNDNPDGNDSDSWWATQFQPSDARSAFPCFDEPKFKAKFRLQLIRPKHLKSFSNMRRSCSFKRQEFDIDVFETTPLMSTYTLAFLIGPFEERQIDKFSVIARPEIHDKTEILFKLAPKILKTLGNYLNLSYNELGNDKLSVALVPKINFGGMENWGLVILGEISARKEGLTRLLGHELAHMWFGNLVTLDWWDSLWLNEGFAAYFSDFIVHMFEDNSTASKQIYFEHMRKCMQKDVGEAAKALNFERRNVSRAYFSFIMYHKGCALIYMINNIIGERKFQSFLQSYLQAYKYKNVAVKNFETILENYWPTYFLKYLNGFLKSFIEQAGYPLITINFFNNNTYFEVDQEHYPAKENEKSVRLFTVPISFMTNDEINYATTEPAFFFSSKWQRYELFFSSAKWLIVNVEATWYYRVNYNDENWLNIAEALRALNFSAIPLLNRIQIVDDITNLFCVNKVNSTVALEVFRYLRYEFNYLAWNAAITRLDCILRYSEWNSQKIIEFMREITEEAYENLEFMDNDALSTEKFRRIIAPLACKYGNKACLDEANHIFEDKEILSILDKHFKRIVFCTLIRHKNESVYEKFFNMYKNEADVEEKKLILEALGCLKESKVIEKHFWNILSPIIDGKSRAFQNLYSESDENALMVFELITSNFRNVSDAFGYMQPVAEIISDISKRFVKTSQKQKLINFVQKEKHILDRKALPILANAIRKLNENERCM